MATRSFAVFETAIGWCGIAWGVRGIVGVQLPEAGERETRTRMLRRYHGAREDVPPAVTQHVIDGMVALLRGEPVDFSSVALDLDGVPAFHRRVYEVVRTIATGATLTYGEIARRLDAPGTAQTVGHALGKNPVPIIVPCHRVLAAGGKSGGFSAPGGVATKLRMLAIERAGHVTPAAGQPAPDQLELGPLGVSSR